MVRFVLSDPDWFSTAEAAERLGTSSSAVRKRIGRNADELFGSGEVRKVPAVDGGGVDRWELSTGLVDRWCAAAGPRRGSVAWVEADTVDMLSVENALLRVEVAHVRNERLEAEISRLRAERDEAFRRVRLLGETIAELSQVREVGLEVDGGG